MICAPKLLSIDGTLPIQSSVLGVSGDGCPPLGAPVLHRAGRPEGRLCGSVLGAAGPHAAKLRDDRRAGSQVATGYVSNGGATSWILLRFFLKTKQGKKGTKHAHPRAFGCQFL